MEKWAISFYPVALTGSLTKYYDSYDEAKKEFREFISGALSYRLTDLADEILGDGPSTSYEEIDENKYNNNEDYPFKNPTDDSDLHVKFSEILIGIATNSKYEIDPNTPNMYIRCKSGRCLRFEKEGYIEVWYPDGVDCVGTDSMVMDNIFLTDEARGCEFAYRIHDWDLDYYLDIIEDDIRVHMRKVNVE